MIASVKMELWFLDSAEMTRLEADEPLRGLGALIRLYAYLRRQHHAIGNKSTLDKVAHDCSCDVDWLWHIITDYGLFGFSADGSFYSPYLRQTLGMTPHPDDPIPSHVRKRRRALYSEDRKDSKDRENIQSMSACVCLNDTQQPADDAAPATDYRSYEKYLKR